MKTSKQIYCFTLLVVLMLPTTVYPLSFRVPSFSPETVPAIEVRTSDNAVGGCWTNAAQTKVTLSSKLESSGFRVSEESEYKAIVSVTSNRTKSRRLPCLVKGPNCGKVIRGQCFGNIELIIYKSTNIDDMDALKIFYMNETTFIGYEDANGIVKSFIDQSSF